MRAVRIQELHGRHTFQVCFHQNKSVERRIPYDAYTSVTSVQVFLREKLGKKVLCDLRDIFHYTTLDVFYTKEATVYTPRRKVFFIA